MASTLASRPAFPHHRLGLSRAFLVLLLAFVLDTHAMNTTLDDTDGSLVWNCTHGEWIASEGPSYSFSTIHATRSPGCSVRFHFQGSGIYWYTTLQPGGANASITIDSTTTVIVSTARQNISFRSLAFSSLNLDENSPHNITITSLTDGPLDIDFFAVISPDPNINATHITPAILAASPDNPPLPKEAIIGIAVGGGVLLITIMIILAVRWHRHKTRKIEIQAAAAATEPYRLYGPEPAVREVPATYNSSRTTQPHTSGSLGRNTHSSSTRRPPAPSSSDHTNRTRESHTSRRYASADPLVPNRLPPAPASTTSTPSTSTIGGTRVDSRRVNFPEKRKIVQQPVTREIIAAAVSHQASRPPASTTDGSHSYPPPSSRAETRLDHLNVLQLPPSGPLSEISAATASSGNVDPDPPPLRSSRAPVATPIRREFERTSPPTSPRGPRSARPTTYANLRPEDIRQIADLVAERLLEPTKNAPSSPGR